MVEALGQTKKEDVRIGPYLGLLTVVQEPISRLRLLLDFEPSTVAKDQEIALEESLFLIGPGCVLLQHF